MSEKLSFTEAIDQGYPIYGVYYPDSIGRIASFKNVIDQLHFHAGILNKEPDKQWHNDFNDKTIYLFNFTDYYWINACNLNRDRIDRRNGPVRLFKSELHETVSNYTIGSNYWTFATNIEDILRVISRIINYQATEKEKGIILKIAFKKLCEEEKRLPLP